jgi:hypothetical protein
VIICLKKREVDRLKSLVALVMGAAGVKAGGLAKVQGVRAAERKVNANE